MLDFMKTISVTQCGILGGQIILHNVGFYEENQCGDHMRLINVTKCGDPMRPVLLMFYYSPVK